MTDSKKDTTHLAPEGFQAVDGALIAAKILRRMPSAQRTKIIEVMRSKDETLATAVQDRMYNFQELSRLAPKAAQALVREVDHSDLVMSIKGASGEVQEHLLSNMSERKRALVMDDAKHTPDPESKRLKEAQWRVLEKLEELKERGSLPSGKTRIA